MKNYRKTSLAGIATLALVAGTGIAAAQMSNGGPQTEQSPGTSAGSHGGARPMSKRQDGAGMSAQTPSGQAQTGMRNAQNLNPANRMNQTNRAAQGNRVNERQNVAQGQRTLRGRQGAAQQNTAQGQRNAAGQRVQASSGTNVRLSDEQRTRIRQTIIEATKLRAWVM